MRFFSFCAVAASRNSSVARVSPPQHLGRGLQDARAAEIRCVMLGLLRATNGALVQHRLCQIGYGCGKVHQLQNLLLGWKLLSKPFSDSVHAKSCTRSDLARSYAMPPIAIRRPRTE